MKNKFQMIADVCKQIPKDEPITYSRLATLFEELAKMETIQSETSVCPACKCVAGTACGHSWHNSHNKKI